MQLVLRRFSFFLFHILRVGPIPERTEKCPGIIFFSFWKNFDGSSKIFFSFWKNFYESSKKKKKLQEQEKGEKSWTNGGKKVAFAGKIGRIVQEPGS